LIIIITICSESQHFIFTNIIFMGPLRLSLLLVMRRLAKAAGSRRSLPPPSSARWSSLVGVAELGVGVDLDGDERWGTVGKKEEVGEKNECKFYTPSVLKIMSF
jgi:hypothetical protein